MTRRTRRVRITSGDGVVVCERCRVADSFWSRLRGLMGAAALPADEGVLFPRTSSVHTHFMRFPIDVVFRDARCRVVGIERALRPWRFARVRDAADVLELPAGQCERLGIEVGTGLVDHSLG